jgi:hypothetical protein
MFLHVIPMMQTKSALKKLKYYLKKNVPFKNQTFIQLVTQIRVKHYDEFKGIIQFSKDFKQRVSNKTDGKYACCNCKISKKYHIDHIKPLSNNGTNE